MFDEKFFMKMLDNVHDGIYFVDKTRNITYWNKGAELITGFETQEVCGSFCYNNLLNHLDEQGCKLCEEGCPLHMTIADGVIREAEVFLHHKDGHRVPVLVKTFPIMDQGDVVGAVEIFKDNREHLEIIHHMTKLREMAMTDELSGLPNRRYIREYIQSKLGEHSGLGIPFGIIFMDIDNFKVINDTYGHDTGDQVIRLVSDTCLGTLRKTDLVGRLGGEEYLVVCVGVEEKELGLVAEKLRFLIEQSRLRLEDNDTITVTVSIGATMAALDDTVDSIVDRADNLMYISKINGKNRVSL